MTPHHSRAASTARRPLQVAIEDLLCPLQILGNFQLYCLTPLLVGVDYGEKGSPGPTPALEGWGSSSHCLPLPSAEECSGLRLPRRSCPQTCFGAPLQMGDQVGRRSPQGGRRKVEERLGTMVPPQPAALLLAPTTSLAAIRPWKGQSGDFHVHFWRMRQKLPESVHSSISAAQREEGQNGDQGWRMKEFTG